MSSTVERILSCSRALFNEYGPASVSTHRIAAQINISAGNLYYHFKAKEHIVDVLIQRFEERLIQVQNGLQTIAAVDDLWIALHLMLETMDQFRFAFRDADYLMQTFAFARPRLQRITKRSLTSNLALCKSLANAGVIDADDDDQLAIAQQVVLTATCWGNFAKLIPGHEARSTDSGHAAYQVLSLLLPYLTRDSRLYLLYLRGKYSG